MSTTLDSLELKPPQNILKAASVPFTNEPQNCGRTAREVVRNVLLNSVKWLTAIGLWD